MNLLVDQLCPTPWDPMNHSYHCPWDFSSKNTGVGGISSSRGSSWPRMETHLSCNDRQILNHWATGKPRWLRKLANPASARWVVSPETQKELMLQFHPRGNLPAESPFAWGSESFDVVIPSTDYARPTCIMKGHLLCSESIDLNVTLIQKHPPRNIQVSVWPHDWAPQPSQVDT